MQPTLVSFTHCLRVRTQNPVAQFVSESHVEDSQGQMSSKFSPHFVPLSLSAPDALDKAVALGQSVEGVVALAHGSDETAEGVDVVLALDGTAVLVNLGDGDLDRAVILGLDDAVGGAALAGDVTGDAVSVSLSFLRKSLNPISKVRSYRSTISPRSFSILADLRGVVLGDFEWLCRREVRSSQVGERAIV